MKVNLKCIKYYRDEYYNIFNVGDTFEAEHYSNAFLLYKPGGGPLGTLAISKLPNENFVNMQEIREDKINQLLSEFKK